ncbi:MAG: NAD(P)-dependent oxidoreductase [Byssovorax sp.]
MKILITGGAGYLGTMTSAELLDRGHEVRVLDSLLHGGRPLLHLLGRERFTFSRGDVRDAEAVRAALDGAEAVLHLAAIVGDPACAREPEVAKAVNLDASFALFEAARAAGVRRFVFASTCSNYGKMEQTAEPATEAYALRPVSLYAETKVAVERHLLAQPGPLPTVTLLRFATLYGLSPRMRFDLTVNEFALDLSLDRRLVVFGEQFFRPYVHVRDAARAIRTAFEAPVEAVGGRVFNVGSTDENYTKLDIVNLLRAHFPAANVDFVHKAEDPRDYRVSFERIKAELGFSVSSRVPDGIAEIVRAARAGVFGDGSDPSYRNTR